MDVIQKFEDRPFEYGQDCCTFVGECVESAVGVNPMAGFDYVDEETAYDIIYSYGDLIDAINATVGPFEDDNYTPEDGDIAIIVAGGRQIAAVVFSGRLLIHGSDTVVDLPMARAKAVWSSKKCLL